MLLTDEIQKCAAFVAYRNDEGVYIKLGTAFFVSVPTELEGYTFCYIVTAKHIIAKIAQKKLEKVYLRVNTLEGFMWVETQLSNWHSHPDNWTVDVSVLDGVLPRDIFEYKTIPISMMATQDVITDYRIGAGEEVFLTGLFSEHTGKRKNLPIIRTGSIALMSNEPIEVQIMGMECEIEAYLIEARSIGGLSGSPVFVYLGYIRPADAKRPDNRFYLLGLMHGHWDIGVKTDEIEADDTAIPAHEKVNMGIAIVIPATQILEVINQPLFAEVRERRNAEFREAKNRPTSDSILEGS